LKARLLAGTTTTPVYTIKRVGYDLSDAIARLRGEIDERTAPPPSVLAKAKWTIRRSASLLNPAGTLYVLRELHIFGFHVCAGWLVTDAVPARGLSESGRYTFGPCDARDFQAVPSPAPSATALR